MKPQCFSVAVFLLLLLNTFSLAQTLPDTTDKQPIQIRRGIPLHQGYLSYDDYYAGKDMLEEKRKYFPLESTGVWTELNPKVPRVDYLGIHFVNKDTGWACGNLGALIKTTNGGSSWTVSQTNTTTLILKVRSYNGQVVIASGFNGLILRSTDGGENFTQVISGVTGDLWGLQMLNDTLGWACGTANSLIKTTDGGQTWQRVFTPGYTSDYWWIDFLNESYGFIAANGKVLRTIDGGQNWEIIQAGDSYPLFSIDVIDSLHIAAAGYGGTGYPAKNIYSSNAGSTWVNGGWVTTHEINCIKYINPDTGYIVMSEIGIYKTTNRGQEWVLLNSIPFSNIGEYELQFFKQDNIGYNAGAAIKLYKADGNLDQWNRLIINDNFFDVFFTTETTGFVLSGALYKTTDGGMNWNRVANGPGGYDILFTDTLTGYIVNNNSSIYKTTDGGETWYLTNTGGQVGNVRKIFFINPTTGWAVTIWSPVSNGKILKTTDRGENWFVQVQQPSIDGFTSIFFIDSLNGWATSRYVWQTTDGGVNWIQRMDIPAFFSNDVYFYDLFTGWIIAGNKLYHTINGGISWTLDSQIYTYTTNFETISNTHFIITGTNIYESVDTGVVWQNITSQIGSYFTALQAPTNYLAYGVGTGGYIISYLDTSIIPVELTNFSAEQINNTILLNWTTVTETNNLGFEIFRSFDLKNWEYIGFIPGFGTTTDKQNYSFIDSKINNEQLYYKLKQVDLDGSFKFSEIISIKILIKDFELKQNFPNPANPTTNISFSIPQRSFVKINLYSSNGELVQQIINEEKEKGIYSIEINLSNLASGVYFYRMITNTGYHSTKKLILLK
ncbi:MAG: T9SS type A sorting domain-containing protein [Ignavibacterium sp.]|nr:T9SS type A sorting domain-containing protein [Ignavibacterium sp.]